MPIFRIIYVRCSQTYETINVITTYVCLNNYLFLFKNLLENVGNFLRHESSKNGVKTIQYSNVNNYSGKYIGRYLLDIWTNE